MINTVVRKKKKCVVDISVRTFAREMVLLNHIELCMNKVVYGVKYVRYHNPNPKSITIVLAVAVNFVAILLGHMVGVINHGKESRRLRS